MQSPPWVPLRAGEIEAARQFAAALRREVALDLDEWATAAVEDAPRELQRFDQGIQRDRQAVANALTSP